MSFSRQPSKRIPRLDHKGLQLGVGSAPGIDHELVRVYRLLTLAQTFRDAALLQDAEDEEWALATPDPAIQYRSRLSSLSLRGEQAGLDELLIKAIVHNTERVRDRLKETQRPDGIGSSQREIRGRGSVEVSALELAAGASLHPGLLLGAEREPRQCRRVSSAQPPGEATLLPVGEEGRRVPRFSRLERLSIGSGAQRLRDGPKEREGTEGSEKFQNAVAFGSWSNRRSAAYAS